ncbi:DNA polymerase III subunit chi [Candidatus Kinetoplastibacterium blastocrithidii TCC012E]|uniref:DNA polymerase III subunit chi n=2 Tax=Candidatus Kinetoplastidibacterium blastocrithidiae TaxID=233181 RepID=M1M443_9PROT|nr:DNA polymerase III subunit chi [Candidatus Kinetoplastibacterium blastocrithidii]AGF49879.1 DNA polymerase III subunit chi [Candidatus Kinetoplastibacterium blastocrithidii TCC012E]
MDAVCQIINGYYLNKRRVVVYSNEYDILCKLNIMLWTFKDVSFIPHSFYQKKNNCEEEYIIISDYLSQTSHIKNNEMLLVNMSNILPLCYNDFDCVVEIVTEDEQERSEARSRWRTYKNDGHILTSCHFNDLVFSK